MNIKCYFVIGIFLLALFESALLNANALCLGETICKPIRECPYLHKRLTYVGNLEFCDSYNGKVCCPMPKKYTPPDLTNPWVNACNQYGQIISNKSLTTPFIANGTVATPHEFPFMALIGWKNKNVTGGIDWNCGGTLIAPRWVLTAAHCFPSPYDKTTVVVRLGEHDYSVNKNITQDFENVNPIVNIAYDNYSDDHRNDIALIDLKRNATLNKNVLPACLPIMNTISYKSFQAAGWGFTDEEKKSTQLLKAELYPSNDCEDNNKICAINSKGNQDTCQGDSGGPLFVNNPDIRGTYLVVGITSYGMTEFCGQKIDGELPPTYYTKVSAFMYWINLHITEI